jgi:hypothetical protein
MPARRKQAGALGVFFQKSSWSEFGRSLKRMHKDRRARKQLFGLALLLLIPLLIIVYLAFMIGSGAWLFLPFVIPVMWWRARRAKEEAEPMHIAPTPDPAPSLSEEAHAALRNYFAELALIYAVLLDRSGSERFLKEKELPAGMEITSRRVHVNLIKQYSLWDRMAAADRDAVMLADGHWTTENINRITTGIEPLRLLRWILRLDFRLPHVGQQLYGDLAIAHELVMDPGLLFNGTDLADIELIHIALNDAALFRARCLAEAISRGYAGVQDEKTVRWAEKVSRDLRGKQSEDLVLGDQLVSESERGQLEWAGLLATVRCGFLDEVVKTIESARVPDGPMSTLFARDVETAGESTASVEPA